jgi:ZIP family zinc transporter
LSTVDSLQTFHPVVQALMATCFTWLVTSLGAAGVFLTRGVRRGVLDGMLAARCNWP